MTSSYQNDNGESLSVTVSIGGTLYQEEDNVKSLIERSDQSMYFAKQNGRNQSQIK